jgi:hypothetical protein
MGGMFDGFINLYIGVKASLASITFLDAFNTVCWTVASLSGLWMLYDMGKTDGKYSELELTSSREGEIEAFTEKHKV